MRFFIGRLIGDIRGATILEFALVGPLFIAILVAILQTALVFLAQQGIESAAQAGVRFISTGQASANSWSATQFKTQICAQMPPFINCSRLMVDTTTPASFAAANLASPTITYNSRGDVSNTFAYTAGTPDSIIVVRVMYLWPVIDAPFGFFRLSNQPRGRRLLLATGIARTENY